MKLTILAVGRIKSGPERELTDDYLTRLRRLAPGLGFRAVTEIEVADGGGQEREGERLLARLDPSSHAIRLDEHGQAMTSIALAELLASARDASVPETTFLIGGAEGYGEGVIAAVPRTLALGPQTWPHRLVRVMMAEQLYRAATVLAGTPYHKA